MPTPHLSFSTAVLCSALSWHPLLHFIPGPWLTFMSEPGKASVWGCSQQENQPASSVMGCHRNPCGIRFRFTILGFLSVFYAQPQRPDWQICCLEFPWFRLYAFSSKPSSFINLHSFVISMLRSIIIPLDSF